MPRVKPGQRQRAKAPKVRTGCRTCNSQSQVRRSSPSMQEMLVSSETLTGPKVTILTESGTSTGRSCDGYDLHLVRTEPRFIAVVPSPVRREESRSLQFFFEKTVAQMTTFFSDEFWTRQVMQVAQSDKHIRHSLVALSSYHESFSRPKQASGSQYALRHYSMSISGMLGTPRTAENAHIHLMSCILFICIEALQGHVPTVVQLVKAGYGILQEYGQPDGSKQGQSSSSDTRAFFAFAGSFLHRIIAQVYMLIRDLDPGLTTIVTDILQRQSRSFHFASLGDAQQELSTIRLQFDRCDMRGLVGKISAWSTAFEEFKSLNSALLTSRANKRALALLELQSRYCAVDIAINSAGNHANQLIWDRYISAFTEMLDYAEIAMGLHDAEMKSNRCSSPQFHMHSGTVPVLYGIIAKCRDPMIRRRAIALMTSRSLQEGVWNNHLVLGVAQRAMSAEEGSLDLSGPASCKDIPVESRVSSIVVAAGAGSNQYMVGYQVGRGWWWEKTDYVADCI